MDFETTELLQKGTPFANHEHQTFSFDRGDNTTRTGKPKFGKLTEPEMVTVNSLNRFGFLNANLIGLILFKEIGYPKSAAKQLMARMIKKKLVARFRMVFIDATGTEHRSSYVYTLSSHLATSETLPDSYNVCSALAFNQFYLAVTQIYRQGIQNSLYSRESGSVDATVTFYSEGKLVAVDVITLRRGIDGDRVATELLRAQESMRTILVLCESELHALELEKIRQKKELLKDRNLFYITDSATNCVAPFDNLIRILPGAKEYELCTIPIDGAVSGAVRPEVG